MEPTPAFSDAFRSAVFAGPGDGRLDEVERRRRLRCLADGSRLLPVARRDLRQLHPVGQESWSELWPRIAIMALIEEEPASTLPGEDERVARRAPTAAPCRSPSRRESDRASRTPRESGCVEASVGPASSNSTLVCGSSLRRAASTHPADRPDDHDVVHVASIRSRRGGRRSPPGGVRFPGPLRDRLVAAVLRGEKVPRPGSTRSTSGRGRRWKP